MLIPLLYYHRGATRGCCTPYNENIRGCCTPYQEGSRGCRTPYQGGVWGCCTTYQEGAWGCCSAALLHPLPYLITPGKGCSTPRQPPPLPRQRVHHPRHLLDRGCITPPASPPLGGAAPLALTLAPSEVFDFAKLLMYLSSQVHLWSSVLWMLEEYYS